MDTKHKFHNEDLVIDDDGNEISPLDDDYIFWKVEDERSTDPLDDDYCKYCNE